MKIEINLLPASEKAGDRRKAVLYRILLFSAIAGILAAWIMSFLYIYEIQTMKQRFEQSLQPVQSEIQAHNIKMKKRKEIVQLLQYKGESYWPAMLVCLADTKPADITVKKIVAERDNLQIEISSRQQSALQEWKEKLQKSSWVSIAYIRKWQKKGRENTAELHIVLHHEDKPVSQKDE